MRSSKSSTQSERLRPPVCSGNPYDALPDQAIMGYKLRTERWAYIAWMSFDWGEDGDPTGAASVPIFEEISALELYDHEGDTGDLESGAAQSHALLPAACHSAQAQVCLTLTAK